MGNEEVGLAHVGTDVSGYIGIDSFKKAEYSWCLIFASACCNSMSVIRESDTDFHGVTLLSRDHSIPQKKSLDLALPRAVMESNCLLLCCWVSVPLPLKR